MSEFLHLQANLYAGNKTPNRAMNVIRHSGTHSVTINEGYPFLDRLSRLKSYRLFVGEGSEDHRRGSKDTPILVRKNLPNLLSLAIKASDKSTPVKIAPERWFTASGFEVPGVGRIGLINVHPHAAVMDKPATVPRVKQYRNSMQVLDDLICFVKERGFRPVVGGDLNWREGHDAEWSPYRVFATHRLQWISEGLDCVAYGRGLAVAGHETIPEAKTGSDHPWLKVAFNGR